MACDLNQNDEQRQILDAATALLEESFPVSRSLGDDQERIDKLAEFGAFALALDDDLGGTGFTLVEEVLLHVRFGRHIVPAGALAAPVAARIAAELGDNDLAREIATGQIAVSAGILAGDRLRTLDDTKAKLALVFDRRRLELVEIANADGETATGLGQGAELTEFPFVATTRIGASNSASILNVADLLVSAQLLGIAEAARDLAVSYAGMRRQFGKPIGAFQAIKHHCANMAISAEMLSAQLDMAAIAQRDSRDDAAFQTAAARLLAPRVALANARLCIQVHGGIGFSAEADAHRFLKQAHLLRQLGGGAAMLDLASPMAPHR
ncbi:MAG: acyl-CoA dehydrogenase family protein [Rhizobiaceae bacterium]|nr:acyl-CoA dehydrogenase family protein [Rhizobiaceae bacterium]